MWYDIHHRCFYIFVSQATLHQLYLFLFVLMETPISDQRQEEHIDVEADIEEIEADDTEDEELKFDPDKDLWVSVRVERRESVTESSYWVWEVAQSHLI